MLLILESLMVYWWRIHMRNDSRPLFSLRKWWWNSSKRKWWWTGEHRHFLFEIVVLNWWTPPLPLRGSWLWTVNGPRAKSDPLAFGSTARLSGRGPIRLFPRSVTALKILRHPLVPPDISGSHPRPNLPDAAFSARPNRKTSNSKEISVNIIAEFNLFSLNKCID